MTYARIEPVPGKPHDAGGDPDRDLLAEPPKPLSVFWRRFRRNRWAHYSLIFLVAIHAICFLAPLFLSEGSYIKIDLFKTFSGPDLTDWLGTDENGRDVFIRLIFGGRISLMVGLVAMAIAIGIGILVGGVSGFWGGIFETILMRFTDGLLAMPAFFLLLLVLSIFRGEVVTVMVVIGVTSWMNAARVIRAEVLRWKESQFVEAASAVGLKPWRVLFLHVLPQAMPSLIVAATLGVAYAILTESALSFLGQGVQPPEPTWGNMLTDSQNYMWRAPMLAVYPGVLIFFVVLAYNFLGDGLRDALDPQMEE